MIFKDSHNSFNLVKSNSKLKLSRQLRYHLKVRLNKPIFKRSKESSSRLISIKNGWEDWQRKVWHMLIIIPRSWTKSKNLSSKSHNNRMVHWQNKNNHSKVVIKILSNQTSKNFLNRHPLKQKHTNKLKWSNPLINQLLKIQIKLSKTSNYKSKIN